ncbi:uncharacterized protein LOC132759327 isoform X2 [Ruditapes philippinarum]|uniref:uncharacterized protein LOC132759327 isoform X2 n=1 Tax=Ruditapes philippinarum TaxID=129788 RepID=UPI00295AD401|nr:uncharacterized protein LOC132759327 isoform X2 [Ruditapes philippinarum]
MMSGSRTVAIAIEDSEHSLYAFNFYIDHVHKKNDKVVLIHVPEYSNVISDSSVLTDTQILIEFLKITEEKSQELVNTYAQKMKDLQLQGAIKQQTGTPSEAILEAVQEEKADLLILGCRGHGLICRTLLGSVSDYCLHHCRIPVIICKHQKTNISSKDTENRQTKRK